MRLVQTLNYAEMSKIGMLQDDNQFRSKPFKPFLTTSQHNVEGL